MFGTQPFLANGAVHVMKILLLESSFGYFPYETMHTFLEKKCILQNCALNITGFMDKLKLVQAIQDLCKLCNHSPFENKKCNLERELRRGSGG